ncbi:Uncharacterized protein BP5553_04401 [Venustampulla echinocandica]|uniref:Uncharacterized protein n=1 Tax=Venustampulla echinocandica TaxID=2656787 RepID=A0A370TN80_9HELO|nr:Uncharacterized protein BP5553_04401 [Venustampulla echinocandica]RDL36968.1 Uncharacterized protein BP5553_04401 [Venustampulla echinocandica]
MASQSASPWRNVLSGVCFGAALTAAGMYSPSTIIGQMHLTNFHMMKGFLAASASSALAILLGQSLNLTSCKPRTPAALSFSLPLLRSPYDGNLLGGLLIGFGMALAGACPGTVLPQVATGVTTGVPVLFGTLVGGILYSLFKPILQGKPDEAKQKEDAFSKPTAYEQAGISRNTGLVLYEGLCVATIIAAVGLFPQNSPSLLSPVLGGLVIGGTQFVTLFLTGTTLGISSAYEQIGDLFWWSAKSLAIGDISNNATALRPTVRGTAFAFGTLAGSWVLSQLVDLPLPQETIDVNASQAVLGGILLVVGARIAGGCTSGHGISGMSMLSVASMVSVLGMFAGGMGLVALHNALK